MEHEKEILMNILPVIPMKGLVIFPKMVIHFDVGRKKSIEALNSAMAGTQTVFLTSQIDYSDDDPDFTSLCRVGVIAKVKQVLKLPGGIIRILVEGERRAVLADILQGDPYFLCEVEPVREVTGRAIRYNDALIRRVHTLFEEYAHLCPRMPANVHSMVNGAEDVGDLADFIAGNIMIPIEDKQDILSMSHKTKRLEQVALILENEIELLQLEHQISSKVREKIDENQKDYYLREQIKVIMNELGEGDNPLQEAEEYAGKIFLLKLPEDLEEKLMAEVKKLSKMPGGSHEATVVRGYLDTVLELPWNKFSKDSIDLAKAKKVLDSHHYGMDKVKDRILEVLAVLKLSQSVRSQIVCLAGPPGVGKTSIAKDVAKAMGRKFARISLGGSRDEADIRGHRKTYIGAMPGRIMNAVKQAGTSNPVILLDEIDKLGHDFRGDPSSALLEALDGEQNHAFRDHYIELPFDLSKVLFITTANDVSHIPAPLYDRMDVISLSGYTSEEKFNIVKKHLFPKQLAENGMTKKQVKMTDDAFRFLIDFYTREAGVRTLERSTASLLRRVAREIAADEKLTVKLTPQKVEELLGPKKYKQDDYSDKNEIGVANGLAWTSVGGTILAVEAVVYPGDGKLKLTGSLGDVMKESAQTAVSVLRARAHRYGLAEDFYKTKDVHIHFPEGATPKDGPSAGITIVTALLSALQGAFIKSDLAMTGEITLRGKVLPIGGLKEKLMAAYRVGISTVLIPHDNVPDLQEADKEVLDHLTVIPVKTIEEVIDHAIEKTVALTKLMETPMDMITTVPQ